jgi:sugar phosphate isomerase/epimerase
VTEWLTLADRLGASYLRVFDATARPSLASEDAWETILNVAHEIHRRAEGYKVEPIIETHSFLLSPEKIVRFFEGVPEGFGLLWDVHHTWVNDPFTPAEIIQRCGGWIRHLHIKDSQTSDQGYRYVLPGTGDFPWLEVKLALKNAGLSPSCSLEWEKLWHPELPAIDQALTSAVEYGWF